MYTYIQQNSIDASEKISEKNSMNFYTLNVLVGGNTSDQDTSEGFYAGTREYGQFETTPGDYEMDVIDYSLENRRDPLTEMSYQQYESPQPDEVQNIFEEAEVDTSQIFAQSNNHELVPQQPFVIISIRRSDEEVATTFNIATNNLRFEQNPTGYTIRFDLSNGMFQQIPQLSLPSEDFGHFQQEFLPVSNRLDWENLGILISEESIQVPINPPRSNLKSDYYKNFPKKLIDTYLVKAGITGGKRTDSYSDKIKSFKLRDNASIKKIAKCWTELPGFQKEFTEFVVRRIESGDLKISPLASNVDHKILWECYTLMLNGLKKALNYLEEEGLMNKYEPAHFWPKVEFKNPTLSKKVK